MTKPDLKRRNIISAAIVLPCVVNGCNKKVSAASDKEEELFEVLYEWTRTMPVDPIKYLSQYEEVLSNKLQLEATIRQQISDDETLTVNGVCLSVLEAGMLASIPYSQL